MSEHRRIPDWSWLTSVLDGFDTLNAIEVYLQAYRKEEKKFLEALGLEGEL